MISLLLSQFAEACNGAKPSFFGIPTWYKYLPLKPDIIDNTKCVPDLNSFSDISKLPLIGLAIVDMLLYVAGIVVVGYLIYGAFLYMTSQGQPEKVANGKNTIINALVGLVITFLAITIVNFIGATLK